MNTKSANACDELTGIELLPCPCCAGTNMYWGGTQSDRWQVLKSDTYGRIVCRDCGLGTTPCPTSNKLNAAAQWNVRLKQKSHPSEYWLKVREQEEELRKAESA